jgi:pimeloyl-ACP methyl ester carboxylesterase
MCVALYAENYPEKVLGLAPISAVVSGKLSLETHTKEKLLAWRTTGYEEVPSASKPGIMKRLKWSHMIDRLKYDLLGKAKRLNMQVLMIVGDKDQSTPLKHQRILYDKISGKKELHEIRGASHTFRERKHVNELKTIFLGWIKSLDQKP